MNSPKPPLIPVMLINFLVMIVYLVLTPKTYPRSSDALFIFGHSLLIFFSGGALLNTKHKHIGQALIQTSFLLPVVGFGLCVGKQHI